MQNAMQNLKYKVKEAFNATFVLPDGKMKPDKQYAYVLALQFDLLPENLRESAARHLAESIKRANYHLTTGFVATPYLCHVRSKYGQLDTAYKLLLQDTTPSWLYQVKQGATTIWEQWNVFKENGDVGLISSQNHYAYGAIGDWLYRVVAGIDTVDAGYTHLKIQPRPGGGLTHAQASYDSIQGKVRSAWKIEAGIFTLEVNLPPNTSAEVYLPDAHNRSVHESGIPLEQVEAIQAQIVDKDYRIQVGSGDYIFTVSG
jgi:alpha-L-rhamnosidase